MGLPVVVVTAATANKRRSSATILLISTSYQPSALLSAAFIRDEKWNEMITAQAKPELS